MGAAEVPAVQPVWDLPIRLFHWTLAALIAFSWWSAENRHLDWHFYSGFAVCSLLVFRLLYGFVGSSTARFTNFVRGPGAVRTFLKDSSGWRMAGHTPLGALSVLGLLGAIAVQVGLGMFAQDEDGLEFGPLAKFISVDASDKVTSLHQFWWNVVLALIVLHVGAIAYYKVIAKKPLVKAMITGEGQAPAGAAPLVRARWWVAVLCLVVGIAVTRWIIAGVPPFGP